MLPNFILEKIKKEKEKKEKMLHEYLYIEDLIPIRKKELKEEEKVERGIVVIDL